MMMNHIVNVMVDVDKMEKTFIVFDSAYMVRENIGFVRCNNEDDVKNIVLKLIKANYGMEQSKALDYLNDNIIFTKIDSNLNNNKLHKKYAEGFNWMSDLSNVKEEELRQGKEERDKLILKLKSKVNNIKKVKT